MKFLHCFAETGAYGGEAANLAEHPGHLVQVEGNGDVGDGERVQAWPGDKKGRAGLQTIQTEFSPLSIIASFDCSTTLSMSLSKTKQIHEYYLQ